MKKELSIIFLLICLVSCSREAKEEVIEEKRAYELIQVQFYPSFLSPAVLTCDLNNSKVLFQRIGFRDKMHFIEEEVIEIFSPKSSYYVIDSLDVSFLRDSILNRFTETDFQDMSEYPEDGIASIINITTNQNEIFDFELMNHATANQHRLILKLF